MTGQWLVRANILQTISPVKSLYNINVKFSQENRE